jgi:DNA-binding XRE family transcriptional regulator
MDMNLTLRQWRRAKEITQEKMADTLGVHVNTYQNWEEDPGKISIDKAFAIADFLGISINEINFKKEEG